MDPRNSGLLIHIGPTSAQPLGFTIVDKKVKSRRMTMNQNRNIKKIYHAAIYVRLSKEDGAVASHEKAESNSIANQKSLIREFLKSKNDIVIEQEYVDDGFSGSNFERPAFQMMLEDIKKGKIDFKVDKNGIVHSSIGKVSFTPEQIVENAREFVNTLIKLKPATAKGTYVKSIYLSSTMSPGVKVDTKSVDA